VKNPGREVRRFKDNNERVSKSLRVAVRLAYLGQGFAGWQRQTVLRTVQGELEWALEKLYGTPVTVIGAGRTDAGVHAAGQVAHFDPPRELSPHGLLAALNTLLPGDVRVLGVRRVPAGFHARRSASRKIYRYRIAWGAPLAPWEAQRRVLLPGPLALPAMEAAAQLLTGTHDFAAFARAGHAGTGRRGTTRTLQGIRLISRGRRLDLVLAADGFLRGMARRLVGALLEVGRGAQPVHWVELLVSGAGTRPPAPTAPAYGLTLERVVYCRRATNARPRPGAPSPFAAAP